MLPSLSESTPFFSTSFHLQKDRQWKGACVDSAAEIGVKINLGEMQRQSGKVSALIAYESLCCERSGQRGGWNCLLHCWLLRAWRDLGARWDDKMIPAVTFQLFAFFSSTWCRHPNCTCHPPMTGLVKRWRAWISVFISSSSSGQEN